PPPPRPTPFPYTTLFRSPPFLATLELHHALGAADEDGHQHSTADLCSWVQSHASSSTVDCSPVLVSQAASSVPDVSRGDLVAARSEEHTSELQSRFDLVC